MLLTIEKVAALKHVEIFAGTPDHVLASVASVAVEKRVAPGEEFIQKGMIDNMLYIILEGEVRVHDGDSTMAILKARESVGEMQVLDPDRRSASVSAISKTFLLGISKTGFDEVLMEHPDIAMNVIRVLTRRIRNMNVVPIKPPKKK